MVYRWLGRPPRLGSERIRRLGAPLAALSGIAGIAAAGWVLAGGDLASALPLVAQPSSAAAELPAGGVPVQLDSVPAGADVRLDGARRGRTR